MTPPADLHTELALLRQQHSALQSAYAALQAEKAQQEAAARSWLEQRTHELQAEAREQRKAETLQRVFYRIAERAAANLSFYDFLQAVHGLLGELLYARNCYVCLYDAQRQRNSFPYYVDERDGDAMQRSDVPFRRGLTEFVLRTRRPQIIDPQRLQQLQQNGEVTEASGDLTFTSWLGVPMFMRGTIGGALVVQRYEAGSAYDEADAGILSFVANHVSSAIERHQALDEMRKSEERYRTVIEKVGVGVVVVQDERMVFANPSLVRIVGHPLQVLLSQPFSATVHPDDLPAMLERHRRRLRGEPVESFYGFRVVTQAGEVRSLELSAVRIEWEKREATLLFVVDATARLAAEQGERLMLQRQSELNDMKTRFISMASHEFRTPLAVILSSAELLKYYGERMPPQERASSLGTIEDGVRRMTGMLNRVLLLGKAEAHRLEYQPQELDLPELCRNIAQEALAEFPHTRCTLAIDLAGAPVRSMVDEKLMRHILSNLLSNAIKYSPQGGTVEFRVGQAGGRTVFEVADHGIGIPADDIAGLFESFHRARNVGDIPGTGLGLAIVKNSVDLHRGEIAVHSEVGKGTRFTVGI